MLLSLRKAFFVILERGSWLWDQNTRLGVNPGDEKRELVRDESGLSCSVETVYPQETLHPPINDVLALYPHRLVCRIKQ